CRRRQWAQANSAAYFCLLSQPLGNPGAKLADAECLDQPVTDVMLPFLDCGPDGQGQIVGLAGIDHPSKFSIEQRGARSVDRAAAHRNTAGRGLQKRDAETFPAARHHVYVSQVVVRYLFGFGDTACKDNVVREPPRSSFRFEPGSVRPVANNKVAQIGQLPQQARHHVNDLIDALVSFFSHQAPYCEHDNRGSKSVAIDKRRITFARLELIEVDTVWKNGSPRCW